MKRNEKLLEIRNNLYDNLPVGEVNAFDLTTVIKNHLEKLDELIDDEPLPSKEEGWISVGHRFPEIGDKVLVSVNDGWNVLMAHYAGNSEWDIYYIDGRKRIAFTQKVTHYMPLPQPPTS